MSHPELPEPDVLREALLERLGSDLRSLVEYTPESAMIRYLREDIDETAAEGRLVRIEDLYQAERLRAAPVTGDDPLGRLRTSIHAFDGATVVHLVDPAGPVYGFSVGADAEVDLLEVAADLLEGE